MKKLILLALTAFVMSGCYERNDDGTFHAPDYRGEIWNKYTTIVIDSCEYISGGYRLAHKGNCRFCAERRNQELKKMVEQLKK